MITRSFAARIQNNPNPKIPHISYRVLYKRIILSENRSSDVWRLDFSLLSFVLSVGRCCFARGVSCFGRSGRVCWFNNKINLGSQTARFFELIDLVLADNGFFSTDSFILFAELVV